MEADIFKGRCQSINEKCIQIVGWMKNILSLEIKLMYKKYN